MPLNGASIARASALWGFLPAAASPSARHSLNALGQFVFRASYRDPATKVYYAGIFRGSGLSVNELLLSQTEPVAELPPGLYDVDGSRFGIDDSGTAYYAVTVPGQTRPRSNKYSGGDPSKKPEPGSRERVWVGGYTRADGTKVAGHYRATA